MNALLEQIRKRPRDRRAKLAVPTGEGLGYVDPKAELLDVDTRANSATFIISTVDQDRDGDVMVPEGVLPYLPIYQRNPIVCYDHKLELLPIGVSESPTKRLAISVERDKVIGTVWFHDETSLARDVSRLVQKRILRGASVGFLPHKGEPIQSRRSGSRGGMLFTEWELSEWSVVGVPCNASAIRVDDLKGIDLETDLIRKGLKHVLPRKLWWQGIEIPRVNKMATNTKADIDEEDDEVVSEDDSELEEVKADDPEEEANEDDTEEEVVGEDSENTEIEEEEPEEKNQEPSVPPPGAMALADLHKITNMMCTYCKDSLATNEKEPVVEYLQSTVEALQSKITEIASLAESVYPQVDFGSLTKVEEPEVVQEEEEDEPTELNEPIAKRLSKAKRGVVKEAAEFLEDMGGREEIPKSLRGGHRYHAKALADAITEMDQPSDDKEPDVDPEETKRLKRELALLSKSLRGK